MLCDFNHTSHHKLWIQFMSIEQYT